MRPNGTRAVRRIRSFDVYADSLSEEELNWLIVVDLEVVTIVQSHSNLRYVKEMAGHPPRKN